MTVGRIIFEYLLENIFGGHVTKQLVSQDMLNKLGKDGWELIDIVGSDKVGFNNTVWGLFKRQKTETGEVPPTGFVKSKVSVGGPVRNAKV